jgi:flagellar biosynthesis protein FliQ
MVVALVLLFAGPALLETLLGFTIRLLEGIPELIG